MMPSPIQIVEVGPRDGLQNESRIWSVEQRVHLVNLLGLCGFREVEVGSFVSPKWIPQMDQTDHILTKIHPHPPTIYSTLVPNLIGLEKAISAKCSAVSIFAAASETFSQKNINCSIAESFDRFSPLFPRAKEAHVRIRGYVSCVVECPYEGPIAPDQVATIAEKLYKMGCREISLGDTIGKGTPESIQAMVDAVCERVPVSSLAIHCHDTFGNALSNIIAALECGIRIVDSSVAGLGGCPYAGGKARGNVATELVVDQLPQQGYTTMISQEALEKAVAYVQEVMQG